VLLHQEMQCFENAEKGALVARPDRLAEIREELPHLRMLAARDLDRILGNEADLCECRKDNVFLDREMTIHRGDRRCGGSTDGCPIRAAGAGFGGGAKVIAAVVILGKGIGHGRHHAVIDSL
jgi:hypothetical protein